MNTTRSANSKGALYITILMIVACAAVSRAYSFMPLVTCYSDHEKLCATQAWNAAQDSCGTIYFGTSDGLLSYDGIRWELLALPDIQIVRSVLSVGDRIYISGPMRNSAISSATARGSRSTTRCATKWRATVSATTSSGTSFL